MKGRCEQAVIAVAQQTGVVGVWCSAVVMRCDAMRSGRQNPAALVRPQGWDVGRGWKNGRSRRPSSNRGVAATLGQDGGKGIGSDSGAARRAAGRVHRMGGGLAKGRGQFSSQGTHSCGRRLSQSNETGGRSTDNGARARGRRGGAQQVLAGKTAGVHGVHGDKAAASLFRPSFSLLQGQHGASSLQLRHLGSSCEAAAQLDKGSAACLAPARQPSLGQGITPAPTPRRPRNSRRQWRRRPLPPRGSCPLLPQAPPARPECAAGHRSRPANKGRTDLGWRAAPRTGAGLQQHTR